MKGEIAASVMCIDFYRMADELSALETAGVEYLHFDIMDGHFVPNITLGPCVVDALRAHTNIIFDIHLMVDRPEEKLDFFDISDGDYVSVHVESTNHLQRTLANIRAKGAHPGVAINPATPICVLEEIVDDIDFVLVMTVNPGFAGQKLVKSGLKKIKKLSEFLDGAGRPEVKIQVDGNVNLENAKKMRLQGADIFVGGTSGLFQKNKTIEESVKALREVIA